MPISTAFGTPAILIYICSAQTDSFSLLKEQEMIPKQSGGQAQFKKLHRITSKWLTGAVLQYNLIDLNADRIATMCILTDNHMVLFPHETGYTPALHNTPSHDRKLDFPVRNGPIYIVFSHHALWPKF